MKPKKKKIDINPYPDLTPDKVLEDIQGLKHSLVKFKDKKSITDWINEEIKRKEQVLETIKRFAK